MSFEVKSGTLPAPARANRKYPFPQMKVGDYFDVPADVYHSARMAAVSYGRMHGCKFQATKRDGGPRIWRIA